jgi:cyclopropane-fatty-acyl-phospholipid synthase
LLRLADDELRRAGEAQARLEMHAMNYDRILDQGRYPDWLLRTIVRVVLYRGLRTGYSRGIERLARAKQALLRKFRRGPIAIHTQDANLQHYEVESQFFNLTLGPWLKYSCCHWPAGADNLAAAEIEMLKLTCQRADIEDGMKVLDLGCGWGSLTRWIAKNYPDCSVTALSNSKTQGDFIRQQCARDKLSNVKVITANVAETDFETSFDRVLSIEMFEHMKNYQALLARIASWLNPGGKLFVHHFSHREFLYEFNAQDPTDFMARRYFAGGTMPSDDMLLHFQDDLRVREHWRVSGAQYARTLRAWLDNLYAHRSEIEAIFTQRYGPNQVKQAFNHWRLFFLICEETFALKQGTEYLVTHMLLDKP